MARDNEHYPYKLKWACFDCRKCFKQHPWVDFRDKGLHKGREHIVRCPQCHKPMTHMGWDFKVPKHKDIEQWKKVELLAQDGYIFHSLCYWNEPHKGPGPRPSRLKDVPAFLEEQKQLAEKAKKDCS